MKSLINTCLSKFGYQISKSHGIPASYKLYDTLNSFDEFMEQTKDVKGDIVECGVGLGHSLSCIYYLNHKENKRNIWAFDSFEGFPEPTIEDTSARNPKKGEWKLITPDDLKDILFRRCKFPPPKGDSFKLVKGYFEDTLPNSQVSQIALLHLDVDLYGSYKTCLENLYDKVSTGGIIIFDEYKQKDTQKVFPGAAKAIDEFFLNKEEEIQYNSKFDKYFIIKS